jgi:hypothetical protein
VTNLQFELETSEAADGSAAAWPIIARCGFASAVCNTVLLVLLGLVGFERDAGEPQLALQLRIVDEKQVERVADDESPPVVVVRPPALERPKEMLVVAKDETQPPPRAATAVASAKLSDFLESLPKRLSKVTPATHSETKSRPEGAKDVGPQGDDWTGWENLVVGEGGNGTRETMFFGIPTFAQRIVYVVDSSGSMRGERFARARGELLTSVEQLGSLQSLAVFFFNDHRNTRVYPRPGELAVASEQKKSELQLWADVIKPRGYTHPTRVIRQALKLQPDVIFFLSDGEIPENTVRVATKDNEDGETIIHTICFQNVDGHDLLKQMAEENGGEFRFVE